MLKNNENQGELKKIFHNLTAEEVELSKKRGQIYADPEADKDFKKKVIEEGGNLGDLKENGWVFSDLPERPLEKKNDECLYGNNVCIPQNINDNYSIQQYVNSCDQYNNTMDASLLYRVNYSFNECFEKYISICVDNLKEKIDYYQISNGITVTVFNRNENVIMKKSDRLTNFRILPKCILSSTDGIENKVYYILKCVRGVHIKEVKLESKEFQNENWIMEKLGPEYRITSTMSDGYKYLKEFISELVKDLPIKYKYKSVGWIKINGQNVYLHDGGVIGNIDNKYIYVDSNKIIKIDKNMSNDEATNGALHLLNLSNNKEKVYIPFLYMHLAVVKQLFADAGVTPKFVLWIFGQTGSLKTSVAKVFFRLFNTDDSDFLQASFKDTSTAIEIQNYEYKDSISIIDDYFPAIDPAEKKKMRSIVSDILRRYGDNKAKCRSNKYLGKARSYPARGLAVITGEDIIDGDSDIARIIGIEVSRGDFNKDVLSYFQNNPLIVSTHLYYFIEWVSYNYDGIVNYIRNNFKGYRDNVEGIFNHGRYTDSYAILMLIRDIIFAYFKEFYNDITDEYIVEYSNVVISTIQNFTKTSINQNPAIMYLKALNDIIESGKCILVPKDAEETNSGKIIIGYYDEQYYYLIAGEAYNQVVLYWKKSGISFPVKSDTVNKNLEQIGVLKTTKEGKQTRRTTKVYIKFTKDVKRYLKLEISQMKNILNNIG